MRRGCRDRRAGPLQCLCLRRCRLRKPVRYELWRPNREKAQCKTMKAVVAFVLLVSAGLLLVITIGGWSGCWAPASP